MTASFLSWIQLLLLSGVVLYTPALVLETTTGISETGSILIIGLVCAIHSTMGGIKAVLITDVLQALFVCAAIIMIFGVASAEVGGLSEIWRIASDGHRLEFDNFSIDPTERHTLWSLSIGSLCIFLSQNGVNQLQVQRLLCVKNIRASQTALWINLPLFPLVYVVMSLSGLSLYSKYYKCDPVAQGRISSMDMLMPIYVMDVLSHIPGVAGLFIAGIFSAALSTITAAQNSLAAVTLEDYLKPIYKKTTGKEFSSSQSIIIAKILALAFGMLTIAIAFLAQLLGGVFQASFTVIGIVGGPLLAAFTLGMGTEIATESGVIIGVLTALPILFWIGFGQPRPVPQILPVSTVGCDASLLFNATVITSNVAEQSTLVDDSSYLYLYRISYMWYCPLGFLITCAVGIGISMLIQFVYKEDVPDKDPNLFFSYIEKRIRKRQYDFQNKKCLTLYDLKEEKYASTFLDTVSDSENNSKDSTQV